eukprot:CAMPEP_0170565366 /NCGR_PEP_ID=MMETSP0211-20121228/78418_1 /TAXON_ID=311385 /ORGANISM="Pseudokeronopsis sp., Strain OXSARD2" /LENGTH=46 /DNA_ID= /DNA_START= /DNA_END= /DNA_ORIENTATION=
MKGANTAKVNPEKELFKSYTKPYKSNAEEKVEKGEPNIGFDKVFVD